MSQVSARYRIAAAASRWTFRLKQLIPFIKFGNVTPTSLGRFQKVNSQNLSLYTAQIERIAESPLLQSSDALPKLLRYLASHSLRSPNTHLKEYQIATEALGRQAEFDPQTDASVRVQIGRLRNRLSEYYKSMGTDDPVLVALPKGSHTLLFEFKKAPAEEVAKVKPLPPKESDRRMRLSSRQVNVLVALLTAVLTSCLFLLAIRLRSGSLTAEQPDHTPIPQSLTTFWSPFLNSSSSPFVVFSSAEFVGDPFTSMHFFDATRDKGQHGSPYYTGVGEVGSAVELNRLFARFGKDFRLKRSGLFALDDALNNDLIFIGSPVETPILGKIPNTKEFALHRLPEDTSRWWDIVDNHPAQGALRVYRSTLGFSNPGSGEDYAIIALIPGLNPTHHTLILEGISTFGTQAAANFVCSPSSIEELLKRLGVKSGYTLPPFEALLKVQVVNDVPLQTRLLVVRKY
jgi:hypothetical protein